MERILKISKFRNIGLEKPETLVINHSVKKDEIGELVILIGPNNAGKSNVLDALKSVAAGALSDRDVTTLSFNDDDRVPSISFGIRDRDNSVFYDLTYKKPVDCQFNIKQKKVDLLNKETLLADVKAASKFLAQYNQQNNVSNILSEVEKFEGDITEAFAEHVATGIDRAKRIYSQYYGNDARFVQAMPFNGYWATFKANSLSPLAKAKAYCLTNYGIEFLPSIITYKDNALKNSDLHSSPSQIKNNVFFRSLFKAINMKPEEVGNAYEQYAKFHNPATLNKIKKEADRKMAALNKQFNKLYFAESDEYSFTISFDETGVSFGMARGKSEDPIMLEYQSTGFRWFFNFFFNFIGSNELKPGDIVVMDEPATNLHPKGQQELRSFMKRFARESGLTFIIATHSPFLIDPDNYDELRVISMEDNRAQIDNLFSAVNHNDPDSLLPIKESLTIEQNVLYSLETEVVWVEGITDYNYLTMFKRLLGVKDVAFLPCNGIGNVDALQKKILQRLISIKFHKRNLLVDGDKAGLKMKEACKGTAFEHLICISDLSRDVKKFVEIEDLFSEEDRKKFGLPDKTATASYLMKATCSLDDFSSDTITNFQSLFDLIKD